MNTQDLNGFWQLRHEALSVIGMHGLDVVRTKTQDWLNAAVPGEVHLDLIAAGRMEEPLFSTNAPSCRWPEDRSWWYRTNFVVDAGVMQHQTRELVFDGLDYYAQIFLNGTMIGESENAFVPAVFDVTHCLVEGANELVVRLTVGTERASDQYMGEASAENIYGNRQTFKAVAQLRKPQFTYGWDWVDTLPNIGIWRGVELRGYSHVRVFDVKHWCELPTGNDTCLVHVEVDIENVHPSAEQTGAVAVALTAPDGASAGGFELDCMFPVGITRVTRTITVDNPQLWWPNTMGLQPLYRLTVDARVKDRTCETWTREVGLRTVSIDRSPLPEGHRFAIQVNGEDVFCRGGNWIPADAIIARVDKEKYDLLIADAKEANMTMLRIWGGGIYESGDFYKACDRNGILVWQDFMFSCHLYPDDRQAFRDNVRDEAAAVIRRLRHHPCIALWCANNENTWGLDKWWGNAEYDFPDPRLKLGGRYLYSRILPEVCLSLDPGRPYWPGSPAGGGNPDSEIEGDVHWWGPGTMNKDITRRYRHEIYDECRGRFVSEYGIIGPCQLESTREFLKPEELDVNCRAWKIHTNRFEKETTPAAIRYHYADPEGLAIQDYIRYGQMFQALMYGRTIESIRFRKLDPLDDCSGAIIWMYNDCWGETGWTPVDYFLRRKASFYWIRNACSPVRALVRQRGDELVTRVVNDTLEARSLRITCGWQAVDGSASELDTRDVEIDANSMLELRREALPAPADRPHDEWVYVAYAEGRGIDPIPSIWTLVPHRQLKTVDPKIDVTVSGSTITLTSRAYAHGVRHYDGGERLFSDNYFDLIPGVPKVIECTGEMPEKLRFEEVR